MPPWSWSRGVCPSPADCSTPCLPWTAVHALPARLTHLQPHLPLNCPHNRASYATLELEQGRLPIARRLLQEGRALGPEAASHSELLLAEARLERLSGNLEVARRLLESVDKVRKRGRGRGKC